MEEVQHTTGLNDMEEEFENAGEYYPDETLDPFAPENVGAFALITQMRIYDTLLALLREQNAEGADKLAALHAVGKILGPLPVLNMEQDES